MSAQRPRFPKPAGDGWYTESGKDRPPPNPPVLKEPGYFMGVRPARSPSGDSPRALGSDTRRVAGDDVMDFGDELDAIWQDGEPAPTLPDEAPDPVLAFADRWTSWDRWACSLIVTLAVGIIIGNQLHALGVAGWFR